MPTSAQPPHEQITGAPLDPAPVNVRVRIAGLWIAMLFVFVYVDLFSLYRPDIRAEVESGRMNGFDVNQTFLLATTVYVVLPALMVVATLLLPAGVSRITNLALSVGFALTVIAGAIGEWSYYVLGSIVEVALLAGIAVLAWSWPRRLDSTEARARLVSAHQPS